jgi:hypothetical protein
MFHRNKFNRNAPAFPTERTDPQKRHFHPDPIPELGRTEISETDGTGSVRPETFSSATTDSPAYSGGCELG